MVNKIKKTIAITPKAALSLEFLFCEVFGTGQRGRSLQYGLESLGQTADYSMDAMIAALRAVVDEALDANAGITGNDDCDNSERVKGVTDRIAVKIIKDYEVGHKQ